MKVLKFGGKSLNNGAGIARVQEIIIDSYQRGERPVVVVSARGGSTDALLALIDQAVRGEDFAAALERFWEHQVAGTALAFYPERQRLSQLLTGIALVRECSARLRDELLSYGELLSVQYLAHLLGRQGYDARAIDAGTSSSRIASTALRRST